MGPSLFLTDNKKANKKKKEEIQKTLLRTSRGIVVLHQRVQRIVGHLTWLVDHHQLFISLHVLRNKIGNRSHQSHKLDLDLGEVQVWEHKDNLFSKVFKTVHIVTPHFIEVGLRSLILLNGLFFHLSHMLMECSHLRL